MAMGPGKLLGCTRNIEGAAMIKKMFSANPARIGRPDGPQMPDALPESLIHGTPRALRKDLELLLGPGRVLHRAIDLCRYASDARIYRYIPQAVVVAQNVEDVAKTLRFCRESGRHATFPAAGTSLNGQSQSGDILIDVRKHFSGGVQVGPGGHILTARSGTILAHANAHLARFGRKL